MLNHGKIVGESWIYKKELANNVSPFIDDIYSTAIKAGAYGGKILGAGNGLYDVYCTKVKAQVNF